MKSTASKEKYLPLLFYLFEVDCIAINHIQLCSICCSVNVHFFPISTVFTAMQSGKQKEKLNVAEKLILFNFFCHVFYFFILHTFFPKSE